MYSNANAATRPESWGTVMAGYTVTREHEICCGHRVYGHESNCRYIHGHNYRWELTIGSHSLDNLGRVIDFGVIKDILCKWLEDNWDHKTLLWTKDPLYWWLVTNLDLEERKAFVSIPVNPTVENLADYFVEDVAPGLLLDKGVDLISVRIWETSKCSTTYTKKEYDEISVGNKRKGLEVDAERTVAE
jgi:6-pyruvoyltetrahydropterin/6-carboxytetrahydropterin synthase